MTRIDPFSPEQREALKTEIKQEMRHEERRRRVVRLVSGLLIAFAIIAVPVLLVSWQLAKTGFYDVPVLAKRLYRPTEPSRTVLPLYGSKPDDIFRVVGTKIMYDPSTSLAKLPMTEAELTTIAQHGVAGAPPESLPFPIKTMQVAVDPEVVEIYVVSPQKNRDATVRVRFRPFVKDGSLKADVKEIAIGSLIVPKKVGEMLFSMFGAFVTESVAKSVGQVGRLNGIELDRGIVRFVFYPNQR